MHNPFWFICGLAWFHIRWYKFIRFFFSAWLVLHLCIISNSWFPVTSIVDSSLFSSSFTAHSCYLTHWSFLFVPWLSIRLSSVFETPPIFITPSLPAFSNWILITISLFSMGIINFWPSIVALVSVDKSLRLELTWLLIGIFLLDYLFFWLILRHFLL